MSAVPRVSEIFGPTIQGEGPLAGAPTVFVRFGGCDYRCAWCDTPYAVLPEFKDEWLPMDEGAIRAEVNRLSPAPTTVTFSGGNPALYELGTLVGRLQRDGHQVVVETQGSVWRAWLRDVDRLVVSPKPPSSGMDTDWDVLGTVLDGHPRPALKVVVGTPEDYEYAREVARQFPLTPMYLQPCNLNGTAEDAGAASLDKLREVAGWVVADHWNTVRVLPQLHLLLWGPRRGV